MQSGCASRRARFALAGYCGQPTEVKVKLLLNQLACRRVRRFESDMPSHAVGLRQLIWLSAIVLTRIVGGI
jgi:hypothetical protein